MSSSRPRDHHDDDDLGNGSSIWETAKLCGKWLRSVGNASNMWGNDLIIWQRA